MNFHFFDLSKKEILNYYIIKRQRKRNYKYPRFAIVGGLICIDSYRCASYFSEDPITPEMRFWLEETFETKDGYEFMYLDYLLSRRIGIVFHKKEDAMLFMMAFGGE